MSSRCEFAEEAQPAGAMGSEGLMREAEQRRINYRVPGMALMLEVRVLCGPW